MISFEKYAARYRKDYDNNLRRRPAIMDAPYTDAEVLRAYNLYTDRDYEFWTCFKPSALAQSNVAYYDYQIRDAARCAGLDVSDSTLLEMCLKERGRVLSMVRDWQQMKKREQQENQGGGTEDEEHQRGHDTGAS